ncbi:MAG TPA: DUF5106 domain-containing protein [Dysgonamonadaceae bacterium]|nr:DUF5106 domain-containing protein [Dysgonamonadaceae bacterium]
MKFNLHIPFLVLFTLIALGSCTSQTSKPSEEKGLSEQENSINGVNSDTKFPLPSVPVMITSRDDVSIYLSKHYWDLYDFADTTLIKQPEITEQGLVDYIHLLYQLSYTDAEKSINTMLDRAKQHPTMYAHFATLYEKYFYDPNSPFRNDELYIPVVNHLVESGILTQIKQEVYSFQQKMVLKNRAGTKATNFAFTLANGENKMMHTIRSNYLILFFTNPDCPSCATTTEQLVNSKALQGIFSLNNPASMMLTVLSIYPDSNIDEWRKALPSLPQKHWINSYDDGEVIANKQLYDIKAIPTLYLLDKDKKVILKDTTLEAIEEFFMEIR